MSAISNLSAMLICILLFAACSSGSSGGTDDSSNETSNPTTTSSQRIEPVAEAQDVQLRAGEEKQILKTLSFDISAIGGPFDSISIDINDSPGALSFAQFAGGSELDATLSKVQDGTIQTTFYVGPASLGTAVCTEGEAYGPFVGTVTGGSLTQASPSSATASKSTVSIINTGSVSICARVVAQSDMAISVGAVGYEGDSCASTAADLAGTWSGTYSCDGPCSESGTVTLTITQNGTEASYVDDSGARFAGTVCGNTFSFSGGVPGDYEESGTFTLNEDGTATKTSTWNDTGLGFCGSGNRCNDTLSRVS